MKELFAAMALAFPEIEGATKDSTNPHFKSKYADLEAVVTAIKPALIKNDLFFAQILHEHEHGACVETIVGHKSGEQMSFGTLFVPASKNDAQGFGSALTYCRRYSLMAAFGVAPEDDDGNAASKPVPQQPKLEKVKDAPFPQGPAKNITELKAIGRDAWRDIESAEDGAHLDDLIVKHRPILAQLEKALPSWINGGQDGQGQTYEGLQSIIDLKRRDFLELAGQKLVDTVRAG
jgi:hypothetical protein